MMQPELKLSQATRLSFIYGSWFSLASNLIKSIFSEKGVGIRSEWLSNFTPPNMRPFPQFFILVMSSFSSATLVHF